MVYVISKVQQSSKRKLSILLSLMGTVLITACSTAQPTPPLSKAHYPVEVAESIERLELYTRPNGLELSARDSDAVAIFVNNYRRFGNGPLYINVPSHAAQGLGAQQAHNAPAPVVVSYRHLKTLPRDCGFLGDLTMTGSNNADYSYGCTQSANLAAMIQDPRQLIEPLPFDRPNIERRIDIYDKYIQGQDTSSEQPARQAVSADGN